MSTITVETFEESIADYFAIRCKEIRDKEPVRKRGLSGYSLVIQCLHDGPRYFANLDCCWFIDTYKEFETLREASDYIKRYITPPHHNNSAS